MANRPATSNSIRIVRADSLRVHPKAQRRLIPATVRKIANNLIPEAIGTLHAVEYEIDGTHALWVIDGQHRLSALIAAGAGDCPVKVEVHESVQSDAESAALFLTLNTKVAVAPFDKYLAELEARHVVAVGVDGIVRSHGLRVSRDSRDGTVTAVSALKQTYLRDGGAALDKALATATAAWGHTAAAVEGKIIEGVGLVFAHYNGEVDQPALVKKLAKFPGQAHGVLARAKQLHEIRSGTLGKCVAEVVVETYNKGRRGTTLSPL